MQQPGWPLCAVDVPNGSTVILSNPDGHVSPKNVWELDRSEGLAVFRRGRARLVSSETERNIGGIVRRGPDPRK